MRHTTKRAALILLLLAAISAGLWIAFAGDSGSAAAAYRTRVLDEREEGEVIVNGKVAIRIRSAAGGFSAAERAQRVAERLDEAIANGLKPDDITTGTVAGEAAVLAGDTLLVTADRFHAQTNGTTPARLAAVWANNLRRALAQEAPAPEAVEVSTTTGEEGVAAAESEPAGNDSGTAADTLTAIPSAQYYPDWSAGAKKYVPILSVGNNGARVGAAQVQGPKEQVAKVKAAAELELAMRGGAFRMKVYIPIDSISITNLHRVQGCSVAGFVDIQILKL